MTAIDPILSVTQKLLRQRKTCRKVLCIQHLLAKRNQSSVSHRDSDKPLHIDTEIDITLSKSSKLKENAVNIIKSGANIKFGTLFTDHMLRISYDKHAGGWQKPYITPMEHLSFHPAAKVLHYATEVFEGMKAYRSVRGHMNLFRPDLNLDRFNSSAKRAGLPQIDKDILLKYIERLVMIDNEWLPISAPLSMYIRPNLVGTDGTLGVGETEKAMLYIIMCPVGPYFSSKFKSVRLMADPNFTRAWPGGSGDKKMGANYASTIYPQKLALEYGCHQLLWLYGDDRQVTEAGTMNVFMFYKNQKGEKVLCTPPLNGLILPGITRQTVLELTRQWGEFIVEERNFTMDELIELNENKRLLEVFGSGTAAVISPISSILYEGKDINLLTMEHSSSLHERLFKTITDIQYGIIEHPWAKMINDEPQLYEKQTYTNYIQQQL
ncbi:branched-chain-amino-acid aminotransferase, cytosolic isoform X2 [Daktulosphaira vitifoliae]|uniref:branched-chain-amino-acid aminotransferase, cytosolic isoform X2 n=1 Tax=Daktulosphaira vitifoliae TaxID=58002 RepID=UPI0021AAF775|nr:branched-chain-amino-acid aminotransferase, cytosolic isoform X2 [Daktulosphaira vitifoliae]